MKTQLFLCLALLTAVSPAKADKVIGFPKEKPVLTFNLPDDWKVKNGEDGLISTPPDDQGVILEVVELETPLTDRDAAIKEAKATMEDFKNVKYDEEQKGEKDGLGITILNGTGEDEDGKAFINLVILSKEGSKNFVLLSCISSKEGSDKHGKEISGVIGTLKARAAGEKEEEKEEKAGEEAEEKAE